MSNTKIQIKRSTNTSVPPNGSLDVGELGYSYQSGKLFIGTSDGLSTVAIGGSYFLDVSNTIFDSSNASFTRVNSAYTHANSGFLNSNAAYTHANAAFDSANNVSPQITPAFNTANAAYTTANAGYTNANAAYDFANTRFSSNGGSITGSVAISGNVSITGNLTLSGNTTFINVENYKVGDSLIYLASNNYVSDIVDIGFIANYVNTGGANVHTGLYRSSGNKEYYLFQGYNQEPEGNYIDPTANGFTLAVLNADLITSNLTLGGSNAITWITRSYETANAGTQVANASFTNANASYEHANAGYVHANAAYAFANSTYSNYAYPAYITSGLAFDNSNSAFNKANTADTNAANASYLSTGTVPSARISGSYTGITGVGTLTVGTWNADTITVPYGGTGVTTFTTNGVLYGNSSGALKVTSAATLEGQVLQSDASGVPNFAMLDGGTF